MNTTVEFSFSSTERHLKIWRMQLSLISSNDEGVVSVSSYFDVAVVGRIFLRHIDARFILMACKSDGK